MPPVSSEMTAEHRSSNSLLVAVHILRHLFVFNFGILLLIILPFQVPQLIVACVVLSVDPLDFSVRTWQCVAETFLGLTTSMTCLRDTACLPQCRQIALST